MSQSGRRRPGAADALAAAVTLLAQPARVAAPKVTTPEAFFGHLIGADYVLPNYTKSSEYVDDRQH